jgi:hypothetical protein
MVSVEAKKKIEKLRKDGVHITSDEQTNQVECEGTQAQVATARQVHTVKDGLCFTTKEGIRIYVKGIIRSRKSKKDRHIHVNLPAGAFFSQF